MAIEFKKGMFIVVKNSVWRIVGVRGVITADRPSFDAENTEIDHFEKSEVRPYFLQPADRIYFRGGKSMIMHTLEITDLDEQLLKLATKTGVKRLPVSRINTLGPLTIDNDDND